MQVEVRQAEMLSVDTAAPQNFRQINTYIAFIVWGLHCIYCMAFSFSKVELFCMCGTLQRADSMEPIQGRLWKLIQSL